MNLKKKLRKRLREGGLLIFTVWEVYLLVPIGTSIGLMYILNKPLSLSV